MPATTNKGRTEDREETIWQVLEVAGAGYDDHTTFVSNDEIQSAGLRIGIA